MVSYGFCIPDNVCEFRTVSLNAPPGSPLYELRAVQNPRPSDSGDTEESYHILSIFFPFIPAPRTIEMSVFSPYLFDAVSIMSANERELDYLRAEGSTFVSEYGNSRRAFAALNQMIVELISHMMRMNAGGYLSRQAQNQKQVNAKTYRQNQIKLSQHALGVSALILDIGKVTEVEAGITSAQGKLNENLKRLSDHFDDNVVNRIKSLVLERDSFVRPGELLLKTSVFGLLPDSMRQCLHEFIEEIQKQASKLPTSSPLHAAWSYIIYATFICFCVKLYKKFKLSLPSTTRNRVASFPDRLQTWIFFLLDNYRDIEPEEDEEFDYPATMDDQTIVEGIEDLVRNLRSQNSKILSDIEQFTGKSEDGGEWLSGNWLRWSWLVIEGEVVQIAEDPFRFLEQGALENDPKQLARSLSLDYYLYIPQNEDDNVPLCAERARST